MGRLIQLNVLIAVMLLFVMSEGILYFVLPIEIEALTGNPAIVGILLAFPPLISFFLSGMAGCVSDRIGRKPVISSGIVLALVIYASMLLWRDLTFTALLLLLLGILEALFYTAFEAQIMEVAPPGREAEYNGLIWFPYDIGFAVSSIFAAAVLETNGKLVYLASFVLALAAFFVLSLFYPHRKPRKIDFLKLSTVVKRSFSTVLFNASHFLDMHQIEKICFVFSFTYSLLVELLWLVLPLFTTKNMLSLMDAGLLMFCFSVPTAVAEVVGGRIFDKWRSKWFFFTCFAVTAVTFFTFAGNVSLAIIPMFVVSSSLLASMWVAAAAAVLSFHERRGTGERAGLFMASGALGTSAGALVAGLLGSVSLITPVYAGAVLSVACAVLALFLNDDELTGKVARRAAT